MKRMMVILLVAFIFALININEARPGNIQRLLLDSSSGDGLTAEDLPDSLTNYPTRVELADSLDEYSSESETAEAISDSTLDYLPRLINSSVSSDSSGSGLIISGTAGMTLAPGDICVVNSSGEFVHADADSASTMPAFAIAVDGAGSLASSRFIFNGVYRLDSWNWTPGDFIYVSTTAGSLTSTAPSGSGDQVQLLGIAITADIILLIGNPDYIEVQ